MSKLLVTVREASEMLGVGRSKVYDLLHRNELPSVHIDGCRRIPVAAVEEYVSQLLEEAS